MDSAIATTPQGRGLTRHALESLRRHGFREPFDLVDDIIENATHVTTQSDGATVYIQRTRGRGRSFHIVVESDKRIVTGLVNLTRRELTNLGRNYGFDPYARA